MKKLLVLLCFLGVYSLQAQDYPPVPKVQKPVYDYAQLLSSSQEQRLNQKLIKYADTTSTQIVVVTIESLEGSEIQYYGAELAQKWGIGQKGKDNGLLILVSKNDRKVGIQTGYGLEGSLTDALSRRVIEYYITPEFKKGNFYAGLDQGTTAIIQILAGEFKGEPRSNSNGDEGKGIGFIIFVIILIILFISNRGGKGRGGRRSSTGDILPWILLSGMGSNRSSGGGFGSGGFGGGGFGGGFGGGGFGGGGASGSW